jgi:hypothetical protein
VASCQGLKATLRVVVGQVQLRMHGWATLPALSQGIGLGPAGLGRTAGSGDVKRMRQTSALATQLLFDGTKRVLQFPLFDLRVNVLDVLHHREVVASFAILRRFKRLNK